MRSILHDQELSFGPVVYDAIFGISTLSEAITLQARFEERSKLR
jgi:hypothetical protein